MPLRRILADELIRWKPRVRRSRWVFSARYDESKPMQSIRKGWLRLCVAAAVDNLRPHDLRHNFTSVLQAQGARAACGGFWRMEAAKGFRRLKAHKQLPILKTALAAHRDKHATKQKLAENRQARIASSTGNAHSAEFKKARDIAVDT